MTQVSPHSQLQEQFEILNATANGICILGSELEVLFWNVLLEEWTQIGREEILGKPVGDFFEHLAHPRYTTRLKQVIAGGPPTVFSSQLHRHFFPSDLPDGSKRIQHTIASRVRDPLGDAWLVLLSVQDVTDITNRLNDYRRLRDEAVKRERELEVAKEKADEANEIKGEFVANISHELRTPLTAIIGYGEHLLFDELSKEQRQEGVHSIVRNGNLLLEIINDILDMSKIEAGQLQLESISCSPKGLAEEVARSMKIKADEKNLQLKVGFFYPLPLVIKSDPTRIKQVLINLVSNAIKFTEEGDITLSVSYDQRHELIEYTVADTGVGIAPENIERLFEQFVQEDSSHTRKFGGTGLGLPISRQLARGLGGDVICRSVLDQGSQFTFTVKVDPQYDIKLLDSVTDEIAATGGVASDTASDQKLEGKILVAEDCRDNQVLLRYYFNKIGIDAEIAENGIDVVDRASKDDFDLVLLDMQMPLMDGYTAVKTLRDRGIETPVVAFTAYAMKHQIEECLNAGCDDHLAKPFRQKQLYQMLTKWLRESP